LIKVINVTKRIKQQQILDHINVEIETGKCYGFIGYNGSGKTMLLRAICGFMPLDEGEVWVGEKKIGKDKEFIEGAGIVIGETSFLEGKSGYDNLKILAEIQGIIGDKEILDILAEMDLLKEKDKKVRKYSMGMKQRLRMAQALMENPSILILDEPFNALDKSGVLHMQEILSQAKAEGKTILLTSHDERNIELLCDKVFEMDRGKIIKGESA